MIALLKSENNENANIALQRLRASQQSGPGKFVPKKKNVRIK